MEGLYKCPSPNCGYIYSPAIGDIEVDIEPGTSFEDVPDMWRCPVCGAMKRGFKPVLFSDLSNEVREKLLHLAKH